MILSITELKGKIFEGEADLAVLPSESGEITVLPMHIPLVSALGRGVIKWRSTGKDDFIQIKDGVAMTDGKELTVLVNRPNV